MLSARLATGLTMVALLLAILRVDALAFPWYPLWFLATLGVMGLMSLELTALLGQTALRPSGNSVFGGVMAIMVANWAPHVLGSLPGAPVVGSGAGYDPSSPLSALAWPFFAFVGVVLVSFLAQAAQFQAPGHTLPALAGTIFGLVYLGVLGSFLVQTRWLDDPFPGVMPLVTLVATAKGSDTGAYTFGRLFGRRKLWARLSPNKTVEGALGGLAFGVAFCSAATAIGRYLVGSPVLSWPAVLGYGLLVGATAQVGDLMESMIKRDCARKDASATLPGFGGVLDVFDSLLFAAPVAFGFWLWFGP